MSISVFLLDDHEIVRRGIAQLLESEDDIEVVGEAGTAAQAMARIPALRPDVAILDVRLPDGEGVSVCRDIRSAVSPPPACLMLTSYLDDEALFGAIIAGAAGYLLKQVTGVDLVGAVRTVAAGGSLLDPAATAVVLKRLRMGDEPADPRYEALSPQERRILGTHRRRAHQPADRRRDVPGREDRQELRVVAAAQARLRPPDRGSRVGDGSCTDPAATVTLDRPSSPERQGSLERHPPAQPRAAERLDPHRQLAAALPRPFLEVAEPAARCRRVDADPVVDHVDQQVVGPPPP